VAFALTSSRDALVGPYSNNTQNVKWPTIDQVDMLKRWDSGVRVSVCQAELLSTLKFDTTVAETVSVSHLDITGAGTFTDAKIATIKRPGKPLFIQQLGLVMNWASLREDRASEILTQMSGAAPFWASVVGIQPHRHKYTLEVLGLALSLAWHVEMRFKHALGCPRPMEYSPQVQPMIGTPGHGALPSGHATEAFMVARVLQLLTDPPQGAETDAQLQRQAARIAINRTVAGVHFPVDSAAGRMLGEALAGYFVGRCSRTGAAQVKYKACSFDGTQFHSSGNALDFDYHEPLSNGSFNSLAGNTILNANTKSPILEKLWELAKEEWLV
jgi:membrane-associated phospholipid phosphatase